MRVLGCAYPASCIGTAGVGPLGDGRWLPRDRKTPERGNGAASKWRAKRSWHRTSAQAAERAASYLGGRGGGRAACGGRVPLTTSGGGAEGANLEAAGAGSAVYYPLPHEKADSVYYRLPHGKVVN